MADLKAAAKVFRSMYANDHDFLNHAPMNVVLAAQALEALAWMSKQSMPLEIALKRWRILGRDPRGHLKYYYADTPLGALLAAMEGERNA